MRRLLLGMVVVGLVGVASAGQQDTPAKERPLQITEAALQGRWEGRARGTTIWIDFRPSTADVTVTEATESGATFTRSVTAHYHIDRPRNVVRVATGDGKKLCEGRLVRGGGLRLTAAPQAWLPSEAVITLSRPMRRD